MEDSDHGGLHEVSRIIGGLQKAVEVLTTSWQEQDRRAAEGRAKLYEKFDEMRADNDRKHTELHATVTARLTLVEQSAAAAAKAIAKMEPKLEELRTSRSEDRAVVRYRDRLWHIVYLIGGLLASIGGYFFGHVKH